MDYLLWITMDYYGCISFKPFLCLYVSLHILLNKVYTKYVTIIIIEVAISVTHAWQGIQNS
jgi:hypothetical protein